MTIFDNLWLLCYSSDDPCRMTKMALCSHQIDCLFSYQTRHLFGGVQVARWVMAFFMTPDIYYQDKVLNKCNLGSCFIIIQYSNVRSIRFYHWHLLYWWWHFRKWSKMDLSECELAVCVLCNLHMIDHIMIQRTEQDWLHHSIISLQLHCGFWWICCCIVPLNYFQM